MPGALVFEVYITYTGCVTNIVNLTKVQPFVVMVRQTPTRQVTSRSQLVRPRQDVTNYGGLCRTSKTKNNIINH